MKNFNFQLLVVFIFYFVNLSYSYLFLPRTLSEFWHWFVANIPGDSVDDGEVVFDLLFPLVLPEGNGDHRLDAMFFL